jgi:hypothetical protein
MLGPCKLTLIALGIASIGGQVDAATVSSESGTVLISNGDGFVPIAGSVQLAPGGQVMVRPGGMALITYSSDCAVRAGPGRIWAIEAKAPCAKTSIVQSVALQPDLPSDGGSPAPTQPLPNSPASQQLDDTVLLLGGVAIATGLGIVIAQDHHDRPASP